MCTQKSNFHAALWTSLLFHMHSDCARQTKCVMSRPKLETRQMKIHVYVWRNAWRNADKHWFVNESCYSNPSIIFVILQIWNYTWKLVDVWKHWFFCYCFAHEFGMISISSTNNLGLIECAGKATCLVNVYDSLISK